MALVCRRAAPPHQRRTSVLQTRPWSGRALPDRSGKMREPAEAALRRETMRRMNSITAVMNWRCWRAGNSADCSRLFTNPAKNCGKVSEKVEKTPERLQIVHSKHIISQKCSGILILAKGPPNPMRFLPPKTHSKNPSPSGEGFLCFLTCNSPSRPSGPWAGRCDTPASAGI